MVTPAPAICVGQAALVYRGRSLRTASLPRAAFRGDWRSLSIGYSTEGLSVRLDGTLLFSQEPLPAFAPQRGWRLAVGARCSTAYDAHLIDNVTFARGSSVGLGFAPLQIAANGRDLTRDAVHFEYYPPPVVSSIEPSVGPLMGGTVVTIRGDGLQRRSSDARVDPGYKCRWGECECAHRTAVAQSCPCANITTASWSDRLQALVCTSPPWSSLNGTRHAPQADGQSVALGVSLNGQDFTETRGIRFARHAEFPRGLRLLQVSPLLGPTRGGTWLQIRPPAGLVLNATAYLCRFGGSVVPTRAVVFESAAASAGSASAGSKGGRWLQCATPPAARAASVSLQLSLNGQQYFPLGIEGERFTYYAPPIVQQLSPVFGPAAGGTRVRVTGDWPRALPDEEVRCRVGAVSFLATRELGSNSLVCVMPATPARAVDQVHAQAAAAVDGAVSEGEVLAGVPELIALSGRHSRDIAVGGNLAFGQAYLASTPLRAQTLP